MFSIQQPKQDVIYSREDANCCITLPSPNTCFASLYVLFHLLPLAQHAGTIVGFTFPLLAGVPSACDLASYDWVQSSKLEDPMLML